MERTMIEYFSDMTTITGHVWVTLGGAMKMYFLTF